MERKRSVKGYRELERYKAGERITARQAVLAKCCDCLGLYSDGKMDCEVKDCPLYPWMPYRDRLNNTVFDPRRCQITAETTKEGV